MTRRRGANLAPLALVIALAPSAGWTQERFWQDARSGAGEPALEADTFVEIARAVRPALLTLGLGSPDASDPEMNPLREQPVLGSGSGFVIDPRGFALTSQHVVGEESTVSVRLLDGRHLEGVVLGRDEAIDIALLKLDADEPLPFLSLGHSGELRVGARVVAFGSPYGFEGSLSAGLVSGLDRDLGESVFDEYIQIDAPVSPGHSGGPLVNLRGEVVGINTAVVASARRIGFAVPSDLVRHVLPDLAAKGRIARGWIGLQVQPLTSELAEGLGAGGDAGAVVTGTVPQSPAAAAGLRAGDVVTGIDGRSLASRRELQRAVARSAVGGQLSLSVRRGNTELTLSVAVRDRATGAGGEGPGRAPSPLGLQAAVARGVRPDTPPTEHAGLVVVAVDEGGPADRAGLRVGDVLLEAERSPGQRMPLEFVEDLAAVAANFEGSGRVVVLYARGTQRRFVVIRR